jgi:cell division protein FtsL
MTRLNVVLMLAVLGSAMYLVNVQYESRRLFTAMDKALAESRKLEAERERLNLEKRAQATPLRVDKIAREQLQMRVATPAITQYVGAPGSAQAAGLAVGGAK